MAYGRGGGSGEGLAGRGGGVVAEQEVDEDSHVGAAIGGKIREQSERVCSASFRPCTEYRGGARFRGAGWGVGGLIGQCTTNVQRR